MELDLQNPLTSYEDLQYDAVAALFFSESDHSPSLLSAESSDLRLSIFSLISHAKLTYNIDPCLVYLSVNYVDRFLSKQEIMEKRPWISHILVVASLSLAAKMTNVDLSIPLSDLQLKQREEGFGFEAQSVRRMEKILLSTLQWRMRSITPLSFLRYFISISEIEDSLSAQCLKRRASDIIFNVQQEPKLLEYKPSIIAASALLRSIRELTPLTFSSSEAAISSCEYVDKDALVECLGAMQVINEYEPSVHATASGTLTPISVLDGEQGTTSSGSEENENVKRRRLNGFRDNRTFRSLKFISSVRQLQLP